MTGPANLPRRVIVVRCPAWSTDGWTSGQQPSGRPAGQRAGKSAGERAGQSAGKSAGKLAGQLDSPQARAFEPVVRAVREFCPRVEMLRPGLIAFGVRGPARYFGGESALAGKIAEAIAALGVVSGAGIADGLFAALLASRDALLASRDALLAPRDALAVSSDALADEAVASGPVASGPAASGPALVIVPAGATPAFLAPRSVTVLGEPELADLLVRLGIGTLGELAALPPAEVEARFGPPGLVAHRLASGLDPRPLAPRPPLADLSVQAEFDPPAERDEQVVFAAKTLAGQLHARLAASGLACVRVHVHVACAGGQESTRLWRHDGLLSDLAVAERVRWQLDGWRQGSAGESDSLAGGVTLLRLVPDQLVRHQGRQLGLWGDAAPSDRVARAALRVQAMLGHDAVRRPVLTGGRDPAGQVALVPFGDRQEPSRPPDRPWPGRIPPPAPATVYPVPRPASVTGESGASVTVTGRGHVSADPARLSVDGGPLLAIIAWTGPWPVTERWWDPVRACRKARFQLVTVDGGAWLAVVQDGRWLVEASYD